MHRGLATDFNGERGQQCWVCGLDWLALYIICVIGRCLDPPSRGHVSNSDKERHRLESILPDPGMFCGVESCEVTVLQVRADPPNTEQTRTPVHLTTFQHVERQLPHFRFHKRPLAGDSSGTTRNVVESSSDRLQVRSGR